MIARRYTPQMAKEWDDFVNKSSNGTFLHLRSYMDYHADRFTDCSVMVFDEERTRLVALLPACIEPDGTLCSHRGLTYGGLIVGTRHYDTAATLAAFQSIIDILPSLGVKRLIYKPVPHIYCAYPSDDDLYALFRHGASLEWIQPSSAIALDRPAVMGSSARWRASNCVRRGVTIADDTPLDEFWPLLEQVLADRHNAKPVHSLAEMELLHSRFPDRIRLFTARHPDGTLLAGTLIYFTGVVAHSQYIAVSRQGREIGVFAALASHVIAEHCQGCRWFDFGTSCEEDGRVLNVSLSSQKYQLGGRPSAYTCWRLEL